MASSQQMGSITTCITTFPNSIHPEKMVICEVTGGSVVPSTVNPDDETFGVSYKFNYNSKVFCTLERDEFLIVVQPRTKGYFGKQHWPDGRGEGMSLMEMISPKDNTAHQGSMSYPAFECWCRNMNYDHEWGSIHQNKNPGGWPHSPEELTIARLWVDELSLTHDSGTRRAHAMEVRQTFDALPPNKNISVLKIDAEDIAGSKEEIRTLGRAIVRAFPCLTNVEWRKMEPTREQTLITLIPSLLAANGVAANRSRLCAILTQTKKMDDELLTFNVNHSLISNSMNLFSDMGEDVLPIHNKRKWRETEGDSIS